MKLALVLALASPSALAQGVSCTSDLVDFTLVPLGGLEGLSILGAELNDAGQVAGQILSGGPGGAQAAFVWDDGEVVTRDDKKAAELYDKSIQAGSNEERVSFLRQIESFWPEYRDTHELLEALDPSGE